MKLHEALSEEDEKRMESLQRKGEDHWSSYYAVNEKLLRWAQAIIDNLCSTYHSVYMLSDAHACEHVLWWLKNRDCFAVYKKSTKNTYFQCNEWKLNRFTYYFLYNQQTTVLVESLIPSLSLII